jgi:hypothetical protein
MNQYDLNKIISDIDAQDMEYWLDEPPPPIKKEMRLPVKPKPKVEHYEICYYPRGKMRKHGKEQVTTIKAKSKEWALGIFNKDYPDVPMSHIIYVYPFDDINSGG